jgi:hypothetical protein
MSLEEDEEEEEEEDSPPEGSNASQSLVLYAGVDAATSQVLMSPYHRET